MMRCHVKYSKHKKKSESSRWFQPIQKILVKLDHFPKLGVKKTFFETFGNHHPVISLPTNICCPSPPKGCSWLKVKGYKIYCKMYHHDTKINRINIGIYEYCVCVYAHSTLQRMSEVIIMFLFLLHLPFEFRIVLEESTRNWFPQVCASCELPPKTQSTVPSTKVQQHPWFLFSVTFRALIIVMVCTITPHPHPLKTRGLWEGPWGQGTNEVQSRAGPISSLMELAHLDPADPVCSQGYDI